MIRHALHTSLWLLGERGLLREQCPPKPATAFEFSATVTVPGPMPRFELTPEAKAECGKVTLSDGRRGTVDEQCRIWVDGVHVGDVAMDDLAAAAVGLGDAPMTPVVATKDI